MIDTKNPTVATAIKNALLGEIARLKDQTLVLQAQLQELPGEADKAKEKSEAQQLASKRMKAIWKKRKAEAAKAKANGADTDEVPTSAPVPEEVAADVAAAVLS
jgi:hypothetical protein